MHDFVLTVVQLNGGMSGSEQGDLNLWLEHQGIFVRFSEAIIVVFDAAMVDVGGGWGLKPHEPLV